MSLRELTDVADRALELRLIILVVEGSATSSSSVRLVAAVRSGVRARRP